jgi:hypothetical protein
MTYSIQSAQTKQSVNLSRTNIKMMRHGCFSYLIESNSKQILKKIVQIFGTFKKYYQICNVYSTKSPNRLEMETDIHMVKGVTDAFVLTHLNFANSTACQKQSNGNVSQWCIVSFYILTHTWGFQHCSFRQVGQCEGLDAWDGRKVGSTFFYLMYLIS